MFSKCVTNIVQEIINNKKTGIELAYNCSSLGYSEIKELHLIAINIANMVELLLDEKATKESLSTIKRLHRASHEITDMLEFIIKRKVDAYNQEHLDITT